MLDGLLKSKFYTKCKTNLKMTKTRVENIKKKKIAVQKFLKNDIADFLRNGHDMNAYGRAEGLLIEQNMACCYELVENFCANISSNLSLMEKQRECPEECKEAVASLSYAAARFADLPELRNLRNTFTERFSDSLESFTNGEFMERLSPRTYTKEMKLQLLQDIANEISIEWDSKALEQKLFTPPTINVKNNIGNNDDDDKKGTSFPRINPQKQGNKASGTGPTYRRRDKYRPQSSSEEDDNNSTVTDFSQDDRNKTFSSSAASDDDDATTSQTPFRTRPPPYLKPKTTEKSAAAKAEEDHEDTKPKPRSVRQRNNNNNNLKPPPQRGPRRAAAAEEREIDELLSHYSNKKSAGESAGAARFVTAPGRVASMPPEQTSPPQRAAGPARAASFQPDGGGVHPKLPGDFDELAARIAALRGK